MDQHHDLACALDRVRTDAAFARSPQLRRLLEYLVQCASTGGPPPKEYTIAIEALGRSDDFDPDRDAIVRVQAGRLRRALDKYYETKGRDDPVRIVMPVGTYALQCQPYGQPHAATSAVEAPAQPKRLHLAVAAGIFALIIAAFTLPVLRDRPETQSDTASTATTVRAPAANGLPTIVILPMSGPAADIDVPDLMGLRRRIASAFAQFETGNVVYAPRPALGRPVARPRASEGERIYELSAIATQEKGAVRIQFQLGDQTGTVAWAQAFELPMRSEPGEHPDVIVRRMATILLQPFGVITSRERAYQLQTGLGDPRYRCVLQSMDALRDAREDGYAAARTCLEQVIERDPTYTLAHSYLALMFNRYYQYGASVEPDLLEKALTAARRAAQTNPVSSRAHFALFITRFNMGEFEAADAAMTQAQALNKDDLLIRSEHGGRLVTRGRVDDGMAILAEVEYVFPARACTHGFYVFLGNYLRGDMREARRRATELTCPSYPYAFLAKALAAVDVGASDDARAELDSLAALLPGWRTDPRATLARTIPDAAIVDRILRDLAPVDSHAAAAVH